MGNRSTLLADFILMAASRPLTALHGDPMAVESLLQDVFGIVVDEAIRKGTSASEKVGLFPSSSSSSHRLVNLTPTSSPMSQDLRSGSRFRPSFPLAWVHL